MDFSCLVLFSVGVSHFDFEILTSVTHRFASKTRLFISIFDVFDIISFECFYLEYVKGVLLISSTNKKDYCIITMLGV
jgi:hypothetical protein